MISSSRPFQLSSAHRALVALLVLVACLTVPLAAAQASNRGWAKATPQTKIKAMKLKIDGTDATLRVRVCGKVGTTALSITETSTPKGKDKPIRERIRRRASGKQTAACQTLRVKYKVDKRFAKGRYTVAVRAKTTGRRASKVVTRKTDHPS